MRIVASEGDGKAMIIDHVMDMPSGETVIVLRDGTTLELSGNDVELLEMAFASECENCGFDPNADPFEDSADEDEDEEYEDDQVGSNENMEDEDD